MNFIIVEEMHYPTICLNMIVKNESKIITRLFDSVLPIIDTYCICDTGSTDNTVSLIEQYFKAKNVKGKIISHEFDNFEVNRNIALKAAKDMADYILFLDADMKLQIAPEFDKSKLKAAAYNIEQGHDTFTYYNTRLLSSKVDAEYCGMTHEYMNFNDGSIAETLSTLTINDIGDGGSKCNKSHRDIDLLLKGLEETPKNIRYNFYLANTYYDIGEYENAIKYYEQHARIVTWNEEEFYNYYRQGICYKHLNNHEKMTAYLIKAWSTRPTRVESLYELIHYYRCNSKWNYCKLYYEIAKQIKFPKDDILFVHRDVYEYKLMYEYTVFGYYVGERGLYKEMAKLMNIGGEIDVYNLFNNYKFYCPKLEYETNAKIEEMFTRQINGENYTFRSSTPSIIKWNFKYVMNLRYVNYNITPNGTYEWVKNIISINKFVELNDNFEPENMIELDTTICDRQYEGIEDIKLNRHDDKIRFTGTAYKKNNRIGIVSGDYNCKDLITFNEYYKDDEADCEKNWVFIPNTNKMIYKWSPLQIGEIVDNKLTDITETAMPNIFSMVRGSTNGSLFNDEIWFIVHIVHQIGGEPRFYYHMIVKFNLDMKFIGHTAPFKFTNEPIEYCCGLIVEYSRIVVSFSVWDRESYVRCYNKKCIGEFFR